MTNAEFARQNHFVGMCDKVFGSWLDKEGNKHSNRQHKHLPLTRQASKFRRGRGLVYKTMVWKNK